MPTASQQRIPAPTRILSDSPLPDESCRCHFKPSRVLSVNFVTQNNANSDPPDNLLHRLDPVQKRFEFAPGADAPRSSTCGKDLLDDF